MKTCRFLRPCLRATVIPRRHSTHTRFFAAARKLAVNNRPEVGLNDYEQRLAQLELHGSPLEKSYPRIKDVGRWGSPTAIGDLRTMASSLEPNQTSTSQLLTVSGRVTSVRVGGPKLVFFDMEEEGSIVQIICSLSPLKEQGVSNPAWKAFRHIVRRGDWFSVTGYAHSSSTGESSLYATSLPCLMSPSLHQVPKNVKDPNMKARRPHVDMLANKEAVQTMRVRSYIETFIASHLRNLGFHKVTTPLLSASAGGAVARPFTTMASELQGTELSLRIAPELWLKRLMVGGMGKVFEMGPAFRNEGVDATHNPEFTICEFYMQFAELESLMSMTETLLKDLFTHIIEVGGKEDFSALSAASLCSIDTKASRSGMFDETFTRLPFIPTVEKEIGRRLPDLQDPEAFEQIVKLFSELKLDLPANATLPRLLDVLCAKYIEPKCLRPTFITEHPAVLSPLAKSSLCPETKQEVSARAELFIHGQEFANMYEEENSPLEQRKKFVEQLEFRAVDGEAGDGEAARQIDESYLEALEWGLPPTGGWGMGIDRLVMLFTGQKRISDVLPFGNLRNVVGMASRQK